MYQGWVQILDVSELGTGSTFIYGWVQILDVSGLGTGSRCIRVGYKL